MFPRKSILFLTLLKLYKLFLQKKKLYEMLNIIKVYLYMICGAKIGDIEINHG